MSNFNIINECGRTKEYIKKFAEILLTHMNERRGYLNEEKAANDEQ